MAKVTWKGEGRGIDADEELHASINLGPGEKMEVSEACAKRLAGVDGWEVEGQKQKPEPAPPAAPTVTPGPPTPKK